MDDVSRQHDPERRPKMVVNPPVFFVSAGLILLFVIVAFVLGDQAASVFAWVQATIVADFGWFYVLAIASFLLFVLFLCFSSYGDTKLGPDDSEPDYSYLSWFAMLFSAGMGIGLLFFGVAEPIQHYALPPVGEGRTTEAARQAMVLTFFHWGLHGWAVYIVIGLVLAYFAFRRGLPLTLRSALYPLIGERIYGPIGHATDIFAVVGTMFGVATSLGFGVMQVNAGFNYLFGLPISPLVQIGLIAVITAMATLSAAAGLNSGIKRLSELNIVLAVGLLLFVLISGSTVFLLQAFVQNVGAYLGELVDRTFRMYAYEPTPWFGEWTLFYWGWWISWSPFVGMFIARISRGRTIRGFVLGVLLVPSLFTFLWMTVFGNTAIQLDLSGAAPIASTAIDNMPVALFETLQHLPFSLVASSLATLLIITFFVTSADSGALVIDTITSGGSENAPAWQRIFWAVSGGAVAAALLMAGGLQALQTAVTASALPFGLAMVFMCYGLLRALQMERRGAAINLAAGGGAHSERAEPGWQQRLATIMRPREKSDIASFLATIARPALTAVAVQMQDSGASPVVEHGDDRMDFLLMTGDRTVFRYTIRARGYLAPRFAVGEPSGRNATSRHYRAVAQSSASSRKRDVTDFTGDQLISDLLNHYARFHSVTDK